MHQPLPSPLKFGFYESREHDLVEALRSRVAKLGKLADIQPLVLEAYRAGWGMTEIYLAIAALKEEQAAG